MTYRKIKLTVNIDGGFWRSDTEENPYAPSLVYDTTKKQFILEGYGHNGSIIKFELTEARYLIQALGQIIEEEKL